MVHRTNFDEVLARVADVDGWMTDDQARRLYDRAGELSSGEQVVEIGSFRGRSTIVLALAVPSDVEVVAIDPHAGGDRGPQEISPDQVRGDEDLEVFALNLRHAGVEDRIRHVRKMSYDAHSGVLGAVDLLYVDGAHRVGPARAGISQWGDRVSMGGTMLIHDSFSSIGVTLALLTTTFMGRKWRYVGRSQSMTEFRRESLSLRERLPNFVRQALQLPWFVRNVLIKVLIVARLRPLTRLLGHRGGEWPY